MLEAVSYQLSAVSSIFSLTRECRRCRQTGRCGTKFTGFILESDTTMAKRPKKRRVVIKDLPVPSRELNRQEMQQVKGGA